MAELLVKAIDSDQVDDAVKDRRGRYRAGDVVAIMEDGHEWGKEEREPKFFVVKVPGMKAEEAKEKYLAPELSPIQLNKDGTPLVLSRRLYRFEKSLIPDAQKDNVRSATLDAKTLEDCTIYKPEER